MNLFSFIVIVSRHPVEVVAGAVAIAVLEVEVVSRERLAPLAGQVRDGEALLLVVVVVDLKEQRRYTREAEVEAVADGEERVEERLPVGLIPGPANLKTLPEKKAPAEGMDRVKWTNLQVSFMFFFSLIKTFLLSLSLSLLCCCSRDI
jgi:hypothetical protein